MRAVSVADSGWQELWTEIQNVAAGATPNPKWASRSHLEGLTGGVYVRPTWPQLYHDVTIAAAAAATLRGLDAQQAAHLGGGKTLTDEFLLSGDGLEWTFAGLVLLRLKNEFCLGAFHPLSHLFPSLFFPYRAIARHWSFMTGNCCSINSVSARCCCPLHADLYSTDVMSDRVWLLTMTIAMPAEQLSCSARYCSCRHSPAFHSIICAAMACEL